MQPDSKALPRRPLRPTLLAALLLAASLPGCTRETSSGAAAPVKADRPAAQAVAAAVAIAPLTAAEDEAIRKALRSRLEKLPAIDEVRRTAIAGLFEVRFGGTQIIYTDAGGRYIVEGALIDTQDMVNLTEARLDALTAVNFAQLPLKDALVFKQGDGSRKLAIFGDPNCGYCKRFERDLAALPNVTIYTFVMPILGSDSVIKARNIWCTPDAAKAWRAWMLDDVAAPAAPAGCDAAALVRNAEFGRKHRIQATPGVVFADGTRRSGAMPREKLEAQLAASAGKS